MAPADCMAPADTLARESKMWLCRKGERKEKSKGMVPKSRYKKR